MLFSGEHDDGRRLFPAIEQRRGRGRWRPRRIDNDLVVVGTIQQKESGAAGQQDDNHCRRQHWERGVAALWGTRISHICSTPFLANQSSPCDTVSAKMKRKISGGARPA
jgi:hypothetical protein